MILQTVLKRAACGLSRSLVRQALTSDSQISRKALLDMKLCKHAPDDDDDEE